LAFLDQPKKQPQSVPAARPKEEVVKAPPMKKEEPKEVKMPVKEEPVVPAKPVSKEPLPPVTSIKRLNKTNRGTRQTSSAKRKEGCRS
jgi:hypothetical protein